MSIAYLHLFCLCEANESKKRMKYPINKQLLFTANPGIRKTVYVRSIAKIYLRNTDWKKRSDGSNPSRFIGRKTRKTAIILEEMSQSTMEGCVKRAFDNLV
jgi:hypothetical protein